MGALFRRRAEKLRWRDRVSCKEPDSIPWPHTILHLFYDPFNTPRGVLSDVTATCRLGILCCVMAHITLATNWPLAPLFKFYIGSPIFVKNRVQRCPRRPALRGLLHRVPSHLNQHLSHPFAAANTPGNSCFKTYRSTIQRCLSFPLPSG